MSTTLEKFLSNRYTIKPLCVSADLSDAAVEQALIDLGCDLKNEKTYELVVHKSQLVFSLHIGSILRIIFTLVDDIPKDSWYLVDKKDKVIVYSPGSYPENE